MNKSNIKTQKNNKWKLKKLKALDNGNPLWRERFDLQNLEDIKKNISSYWFSALYQQNPNSDQSTLVKKKDLKYFQLYDNILDYGDGRLDLSDCSINMCVDLAISLEKNSDYTVILTFAHSKSNKIFILDILRDRIKTNEHIRVIKTQFEKWKPTNIGVESVQYQQSLINLMLEAGLPTIMLKADKHKTLRFLPMAAKIEAGDVYLDKKANWLDEFEQELLNYPGVKHDDQVDAFAYIDQIIQKNSNLLPISSKNTDKINFRGF